MKCATACVFVALQILACLGSLAHLAALLHAVPERLPVLHPCIITTPIERGPPNLSCHYCSSVVACPTKYLEKFCYCDQARACTSTPCAAIAVKCHNKIYLTHIIYIYNNVRLR